MKDAKLDDFLWWKGKIGKIIGINEGHRSVIIEILEDNRCPNCDYNLGKKQIDVIVSSPLFQENAKPIQTIGV